MSSLGRNFFRNSWNFFVELQKYWKILFQIIQIYKYQILLGIAKADTVLVDDFENKFGMNRQKTSARHWFREKDRTLNESLQTFPTPKKKK